MGWAYNTPDDLETDGPHIAALAIILTVASLLILSLRLYVRGWMIKTIGAGTYHDSLIQLNSANVRIDDWTLIVTWVSCYDEPLLSNHI